MGIEAVIAHEYFHNWTGNRITCRDWFQLCLKEGLTVFRDQEFRADQNSRAVERIRNVRGLRAMQFVEDAGPLAHPVRPSVYREINNFYTATVYEKGAEVVRMIQTLLGVEGFRKGMDLYFERHDGEAATVEEFVQCFADASGVDLSQLMLWYSQAGTPEVVVSGRHDARTKTFRMEIAQTVPPTPGQPTKEPMLIPLAVGLVGRDGSDLPLKLAGGSDRRARHPVSAQVLRSLCFRRHCRAAGDVAQPQFLRAGAHRRQSLRRRSALPGGERLRSVQSLAGGAIAGDAPAGRQRRRRSAPAAPRAATKACSTRWPRSSTTRRSNPRSCRSR